MASATDPQPRELRDPLLRSCVTLAVVLHLLCVAFVFSANVNPSVLQQRLAQVLAPYTQLLHLDPGGARLQLTDGSQDSDDHLVVVVPKRSDGTFNEAEAVRLPSDEWRLSAERRHLLTLNRDMAAYAERDELVGLFARSLGASMMQAEGYDHVLVRLVHQGAAPLFEEVLPEERSTDFVVYEAEVWVDEDGQIQMQKRASGLGAAPTSQGGS